MFSLDDDAAILRGGWDDRTLADMLFMSVTTLRDRRRELTRPPRQYEGWSPSQDQWLRILRSKGLSSRQIAVKMVRTKDSVACRSGRLRGVRK
jgi:hypothetical protein